MYKYFTVWLTGFCLSAMSARYWPFLPGKLWIVLIACIVIIIHIAVSRDVFDKHRVRLIKKNSRVANWYGQNKKPFTAVSFMISGMMSGMIWMASVGHWYLAWQLPQSKIQQDVIVSGQITHSRQTNEAQQLILAVHQFGNQKVYPSPSLLLSVEESQGKFLLHQHVTLRVRLKPLTGVLNPGGDRRSWYVSNGIVATGTVLASTANKITKPAATFHHYASARSREAGYSKWLVALLTGDRRGLQHADWHLLRDTGTGHLFSISGLHVGMIALWASVISGGVCGLWFWLSGQQHNRRNVRHHVIFMILLLTAGYATLANWQVPVARAWLLLLLITVIALSGVIWSWLQRFLLMLVACIVLFPLSLFGSSFFLSAGALALLLFVGCLQPVSYKGLSARIKAGIVIQGILSVLLIPVTAGFFDTASLLTAPVNILAIPIVTLVVPVGMAGLIINYFTLQPNGLLDVADAVLSALIGVMTIIQPCMVSFTGLNIAPAAAGLLLGAMLILFVPPFRYRVLVMVLLTLPFGLSFVRPAPGPWIIHVFDVGQGTAVAVSRGRRAILIDTGPSFEHGNMLRSVVIPALKHLKIDVVDGVILTHGDDDHSGGSSDISLLPGWEDIGSAGFVRDNLNGCQQGEGWQWQGLNYSVLWPEAGNTRDENAQSCVIRITGMGFSLLIAGDISKTTEYALLYQRPGEPEITLKADVLIAPHHGSDTSSSAAFIEAVQPAVTVFTTGAFHRWRLPSDKVRRRYQQAGSQLLNTGEHGYVRISVAHSGITTTGYNRELSPRWYDNRLYQHN